MNKIVFLILFFLPFFGNSQSPNIGSYIDSGVKFYDEHNYNAAIQQFNQALKLDPKSELAHYELALTFLAVKEYNQAIQHCDMVIGSKGKNVLAGYLVKGACLDELGKTEESIKLFQQGIKKFGYDHLLCYNLGMEYYRIGELSKAQEIIEHGIETKKSHASSHMLLGYVLADQGKKVRSMLALNYFLLLEPSTKRSEKAYALLMKQMDGHANLDEKNNGIINIRVNPDADPEFSSAELFLSMLAVNYTLEENKDKSREEMFVENNQSFFIMLGELTDKKSKKKKGLYWELYIPLFDELAHANVFEAYCYYISGYANEVAGRWLDEHPDEFNTLVEWFKKRA